MLKKTILSLVVFAAALAAVAIQYRAGHPIQQFLFNSDGLYLPTVFADLFEHGGKLKDWYLTPAPYFFPDYLLYGIAYISSQGAVDQLLIFGLLQLTAMVIASAYVVHASLRAYTPTAALLIGTGMAWLAMDLVHPYLYVLTSAYHFGAFLSALVFVALWMQREHAHRLFDWRLAAMCMIGFFGALSDTLFMVQTVVPCLLTCMLVRRQDRPFKREALVPGTLILAVSLLGSIAYRWVVAHNTRYPNELGLKHLAANTHEMLGIFSALLTQVPLLGVILGIYLVIGVVCLFKIVTRQSFRNMPRPLLLLLVFSLIAAGGNLLAMLVSTNLVITTRYMIPALCWPLILMVILLAHWASPRFTAISFAASVFFVFLGAVHASNSMSAPADAGFRYPAEIACIDQALATTGAQHGIAEYWDAKRVQTFSKKTLTIAQYMSDLGEHSWITSTRYFRPTYDFAIITDDSGPEYLLPKDEIIARSGPPALTAVCGKRTVLVYGHDKLRMRKIIAPGDSYTWQGCKLPTLIGKPSAACTLDKTDPDAEGVVSFGPYEVLPAGHYRLRLQYASSMPATADAGSWDVVLALPDVAKQIAAGKLAGSSNRPSAIDGQFTIEQPYNGTKIEVRSRGNKGGTMQVKSLQITKLD